MANNKHVNGDTNYVKSSDILTPLEKARWDRATTLKSELGRHLKTIEYIETEHVRPLREEIEDLERPLSKSEINYLKSDLNK